MANEKLTRRRKAPRNKMKTIIITAAIVVIGFMFGRAMTDTASYFLESIKRMNNKEEDQ